MVVFIRGYKVLYDAAKNPVLYNQKVIAKMKIEEVEELGFDITNPVEWKKYLNNYRVNGLLLPRVSEAGDVIVYIVFVWGVLPKHYEGVFPTRKGTSFFPGYNKQGERRKAEIYGRLD